MSSVTTWTRLQPVCRRDDWMESLRARLHDPAWMLARQWQTGEFRGEDAGAPIAAQITYRTRLLDRLKRGDQGPVENLDRNRPLEVAVEREPLPMTKRLAAHLGLMFERAIGDQGVRGRVRQALPLEWTNADRDRASDRSVGFMAAVAGRVVDGAKLLAGLRQNQSASAQYAATAAGAASPLTPDEAAMVDAAAVAFRAKADALYPANAVAAAWDDRRQEYRFRVSAPEANGGEIVLEAEEYYEGRLDWYGFTVNRAANASLAPRAPGRPAPQVTQRAFIPSLVKFPGRPNERWWRFEDGRVNLASLDVQRTELAHVIVSEFALIFANDWFELPMELPVASLTSVEQLRVRDSFGLETDVAAGIDPGWAMFALSGRMAPPAAYTVGDRYLFIPPTLSHGLESPPLEEVRLLRDEMANMAWAVEAVVQDDIGVPISGYDLAAAGDRRVRERARRAAQEAVRIWRPFADAVASTFQAMIEAKGTPQENAATLAHDQAVAAEQAPLAARNEKLAAYEAVGGDLRDLMGLPDRASDGKIVPTYRLLTEVPRNWIPLLPRPIGGGQIMLQRGAMPDLRGVADNAMPQRVRARGVLLRPETRPFYIHEEEVPRVGAHVMRTAQFARWLDGTSHFWLGRRKTSGRGEGWSGLRFDRVEESVKR